MDEEIPAQIEFVAPSLEELAPLFPAYELEAFIAQGGMGAVYKARQKSLDRAVAIKILPREFGNDPQFRASFQDEAKAMARLNHPNLISVYDFGDVDGMLYIIMEFVQGKALFYSIHQKIIPPEIALPMVSTISKGLAHAHAGGIIHRDIKPANILLDTDATPKIGDFGLARPVELDDSEGIVFGTPGYTAPEVYHRQPVDHRSDIFSIGALLYELLVGKHPTPESTSMQTGLDPRIDAILVKATHLDPAQRYSDTNLLAHDLDELIPKLSGPKFAAPLQSSAPPAPRPTLASQKSSNALPIFLLLALLAGGAVAFFTLNKKEKEPTPSSDEVKTPTPEVKKKPPSHSKKKKQKQPKVNPSKSTEAEPNEETKDSLEPKSRKGNPLRSFVRLKKKLREGSRNEFPFSTVKRGNSAYFLHKKELSAHDAHELARSTGASLALTSSKEDLDFIRSSFPTSEPIWLGASDSGIEGKWYWVNGTTVSSDLWAPGAPDNKTSLSPEGQDFALLTPEGLQDASRSAKHFTLLEWKLKGDNPGSHAAQMKRIATSLAKNQAPIFPSASFEFRNSRYLLIKQDHLHQKATSLAEQAGAHLAVFSSQEEAQHLTTFLNSTLAPREICWLGGSRSTSNHDIWETPTGEIFDFYPWGEGEPNNNNDNENTLVYRKEHQGGGGSIHDYSEHNPASYYLMEWSHPSLRNMPKAKNLDLNEDDLLEALEEVRDKTRKLHGQRYRKFRREYDEVIQDFLDNTITAINQIERLNDRIRKTWIESVKEYKEQNGLPNKLPEAAPDDLKEALATAQEDSKELKEDYQDDFKSAKEHYLNELSDAVKAARKTGSNAKINIYLLEAKATQEENTGDARFDKIMENKKVPIPVTLPAGQ